MSGWLIAAVGLVYAGVALLQWKQGNAGMAITFSGYAFSNIGLYVLASK